ncbi:MAG TPA: AcvB/VirJ family lysyl-phosphatidylglycerol hydrolase [Rudaea sp.]|nr:AcvB/VirJ family lysyl-phosphatidylglycerol hydrolase [Rudaea sp.]
MSLRLMAAAALCAAVAVVHADPPAPPRAAAKTTAAPTPLKAKNAAAAAKAAPSKPKPPAHDPAAARIFEMNGLGEVTVYAPHGQARGLALFASGDGGWNLGVWDMAHEAADLGYWVAGFSTPTFLKTLESDSASCSDAAQLLDRIGDKVKAEMKLPAQFRPVLIGYSSGATIAYAALAQAGDARFGGAMTLGFCPDLIIHKPFCEGAGGLTATKMPKPPYTPIFNTVREVKSPWIVLQGEIDQVCNPPDTVAFVDKVRGGHVVSLPHVGHGFSVPKNWMPQYRQGLAELLDGAAAPRAASGGASP